MTVRRAQVALSSGDDDDDMVAASELEVTADARRRRIERRDGVAATTVCI